MIDQKVEQPVTVESDKKKLQELIINQQAAWQLEFLLDENNTIDLPKD